MKKTVVVLLALGLVVSIAGNAAGNHSEDLQVGPIDPDGSTCDGGIDTHCSDGGEQCWTWVFGVCLYRHE